MEDDFDTPAADGDPLHGRRKKLRRGPREATPRYLENAALHYLQRFATSAGNLRRILMAKVERSARAHGTDPDEGAARVDSLIIRFTKNGLLDDRAYAEGRVRTLHRRGDSARLITAKLRAKDLDPDVIEAALAALAEDVAEPELEAAAALARRRRLGPYRTSAHKGSRNKDLAALARAGFAYDVARRVIEAETVEDLEAAAAEPSP
jgi:regulatory protein